MAAHAEGKLEPGGFIRERGRMQSKENIRRPGVHTMTGGRTQPGGGTQPVKPKTGGPGQPSSYGSTGQPQYDYDRYKKACRCVAGEVAKAVRMADKPAPKPKPQPGTEEYQFQHGGAPVKPTKPMHPGQRMGGNLETTGGW